MRIQCHSAVSGSRGGRVYQVANTKLRPKLDRRLPFQVPSAPKSRKRPANKHLKALPPVPPTITQFAFSLGKDTGRCLLSSHYQSVPTPYAYCYDVGDSIRRNSRQKRLQGARCFLESSVWNISEMKRHSKTGSDFLILRVCSKYLVIVATALALLKILEQRDVRLSTFYSITSVHPYFTLISYTRPLSKFHINWLQIVLSLRSLWTRARFKIPPASNIIAYSLHYGAYCVAYCGAYRGATRIHIHTQIVLTLSPQLY